MTSGGGSTVVEYLPGHLKVEGLSPATAAGAWSQCYKTLRDIITNVTTMLECLSLASLSILA